MIVNICLIMQDLQLNYFVISETKLNHPTTRLHLNGYDIRTRK